MTDSPPPPADPTPDPSDARASHRGRRKASSVVLPVVFALALVLVGFLAMWGWITLSGDDGSRGGAAAGTTSAGPAPSSSASPTPSASGTSGSPSSSATGTSSGSPSPSPSRSPTRTPSPKPDRSATVVVFNQTSVPGLGAAFAARLQEAGWTVTGVDNWTGTVPETTIYYRPGDEAAARQLMRDIPQVNRIMPAVTGMPQQGLTLILAGSTTSA